MESNMFTGIVEEIGRIHHIFKTNRAEKLVISCSKVLEGTKIGDSIAVNGTCLTVTAMDSSTFTADVTPETMRRTAFSLFRPGTPVNLERALRLSDRLGGHIMMGHVDGTGRILSMEKDDNAVDISISTDRKWMRYIIEKADAFASAFIFKSLIAFDVAYNIANSLDTFNRFVRNFNIKFFLD